MSADDYRGVALKLPAILPAITRQEAERAARRLYRRFGGVAHMAVIDDGTGGTVKRHAMKFRGPVRRCWISTRALPASQLNRGWARLIHDISHRIFARRHPSF